MTVTWTTSIKSLTAPSAIAILQRILYMNRRFKVNKITISGDDLRHTDLFPDSHPEAAADNTMRIELECEVA